MTKYSDFIAHDGETVQIDGIHSDAVSFLFTTSGIVFFNQIINIPSNPPVTSSGSGVAGNITRDNNYFYICIDTNVWKRTALSSW